MLRGIWNLGFGICNFPRDASNTLHIKLSDLTAWIQQAISNVFANQSYWIVADVTNYSFYQQKGLSHTLTWRKNRIMQATSSLKCAAVAWGAGANKIKDFERITGQLFKNDINVLVKVSVNYHHVYVPADHPTGY